MHDKHLLSKYLVIYRESRDMRHRMWTNLAGELVTFNISSRLYIRRRIYGRKEGVEVKHACNYLTCILMYDIEQLYPRRRN